MINYKMIIRFYTESTLAPQTIIELTTEQTHYVKTVMRRNKNDKILLFNGKDGEWVACLKKTSSSNWSVRINSMIRSQLLEPDIALAFAPVKKARTDFIIEKATELGISKFMPINNFFYQYMDQQLQLNLHFLILIL